MSLPQQWTPDREQQLRDDWAAGLSAGIIGDRLGVSRSTVCAKARRLKLASRTASTSTRKKYNGTKRKAKAAARLVPQPVAPTVQPAATPSPSPNDPPHGQGCRLMHLTSATCRWPIGEPLDSGFFFCGHPGANNPNGRPYCAYHASIAYPGRGGAP